MIKQIIIIGLCCIAAQVVYSAPSGCVDLCNSEKQTAGLSTYQTHAALQNLQQALNKQFHESQMNLDYTRPGNWSEHNQWATDNGAGKVHEERGQLEAGNAKVQYYKKNYTASFGSGNFNNAMNNFLNSQNSANADLLSQRQVEDFRGSTNHAASVDISSELESRLRQLQMQMEQFNSNIHQYSLPMTTTSSFESHMSQLKTRVDQVNNQIHQNAQLHSSNSNQSQQAQQHLQQLIQGYENRMQELQRMLDQMSQQASQVSQSYHQQQQRPTQYTERIVVPETNTQQQQQHHYEYKSHHEQHIKTHNGYVPTSQNYVIPSDNLQQQQQQVYVPNDRIISSQSQYHNGNQNIVRVPIHQGNRYQNYREETGHELETGTDNVQHNVYSNQNAGKHVEEHWSASGHRSESIIPHHHQQQQQQQVVGDSFDRIRQQHQSGHSGGAYTSGGSSSSSIYQQSGGQFRTGVLDLGQTADCDTETTQSQYKSSPYSHQRRYRRGIRDGFTQQTEDLTQQTEDLTQQTEDLTQQTFDNINQQQSQQQQQHGRRHHHEHDHDHGNRHQGQETEDFSQQYQTQIGQLEPGNQRHHESAYDRYGQQQQQTTDYPHNHRHNHNDQQDYYNRHDHRGQNDYNRHQLTQQQDLTQQTEGFGGYSQQSVGNLELTQQSENLNQNNYGSRQQHQQQQLQNNNDENPVVGIEGAKWHTQHHSGDLTSDNYQQQQQQQYGLNSQNSGITPAPGTYGHHDRALEGQGEFEYPGDVTSTTNKPGFWKGVSNKISKTYEKAKDKVSDVFG